MARLSKTKTKMGLINELKIAGFEVDANKAISA